MKRVVLIGLVLLAFFACNPLRTMRINSIVGQEVQQTLNYPYSYDPVWIEVDSAFAPFDSPELYNLLAEDMSLDISIEAYDLNIRTSLMTMRMMENNFSAEARRQYAEARAELQENMNLKQDALDRQEEVKHGIERMTQEPRRFIGFKASHKYHAMDNNLQLLLLHEMFILSPKLDAVLGRYDLNNDFDKDIREMIENARKENSKIEIEMI